MSNGEEIENGRPHSDIDKKNIEKEVVEKDGFLSKIKKRKSIYNNVNFINKAFSQTYKNINTALKNTKININQFKEVTIKEYGNKLGSSTRRKTNKYNSIFNLSSDKKIPKTILKTKKDGSLFQKNAIKNRKSHTNVFFSDLNNLDNNNDKKEVKLILTNKTNKNPNNLQLPSLISKNLAFTEENLEYIDNKNSNNKFCRTFGNKGNKTNIKRKSVEFSSFRYMENVNNLKTKDKILFIKKKTLNDKMNIDKNMNQLVINNIKNKFLKKLKTSLTNNFYNYSESIKNQEKSIKKETESSLIFIEKKIEQWMSEASVNLQQDQNSLLIKNINYNQEIEKNIKIEEKHTKTISLDIIKKNISLTEFSSIYLKYHIGNLDIGTLLYIKNKFFQISLPDYLFNKNNSNHNQKKNPRHSLLHRNIIEEIQLENLSKLSKSQRKFKNNSKIHKIQNKQLNINKNFTLNGKEKKFILYFYILDLNFRNNNEKNFEETYNILDILKKDNNSEELQDLIKDKFILSYKSRNNTNTNRSDKIKKSISFKNKTFKMGGSAKKNLDNIKDYYTNKEHIFQSSFFKRKDILITSKNKRENIYRRTRKSLLEYNLLFDPNLIHYNNLINEIKPNKRTNRHKNTNNLVQIKLNDPKQKLINSLLMSSGGMKTDKNIVVMKTLDLKNQYINKNKENINSLISSIKDCNSQSFVKFYKSAYCGPNVKDKEGNTLLSLAVKSSCLEIVVFLLEEKADPNIQNVRKILYLLIYYFFKIIDIWKYSFT